MKWPCLPIQPKCDIETINFRATEESVTRAAARPFREDFANSEKHEQAICPSHFLQLECESNKTLTSWRMKGPSGYWEKTLLNIEADFSSFAELSVESGIFDRFLPFLFEAARKKKPLVAQVKSFHPLPQLSLIFPSFY
ncbi:hypothetical protein AVEN_119421-1 [Araneus ventricosus]|uniref:Uncharacterized protein n=1 Tax=Araneus ventricosus TaxID=182803 RepID=A0A4Y2R5D6_ARAVE|nr:hypothetical protein AVEN_119421-1 [Araneus ventricosus]